MANTPAKPTPKAKPDSDIQPTAAQKGALQPTDTSETRMFQTGGPTPDGREALTKDEARARGFHWLDTDDEAKAKEKK